MTARTSPPPSRRPKRARPSERGAAPAATAEEWAQYAALRTLAFVLKRVPIEAASWTMGQAIGTILRHTKRHTRAKEHLALALPGTSEAEREAIARAMWVQLGRVAGEAFQLDRILADDHRLELPADFDHYRKVCADGAISATLHFGNWEAAAIVAHRGGVPLAGVYQPLHNPLADRYLRRLRANAYPAGLFGKGPDLGGRLVALARSGAAVGIVADLREKRGIGVTFFDRPAFATPIPAMLARLSSRPLVAGAVLRTCGVRFRILMEEISVPVTDDRDRDIATATQALHTVFERWIRAAPEQWMWTHRKWATSGTRPLSVREVLFPADKGSPPGVQRERSS